MLGSNARFDILRHSRLQREALALIVFRIRTRVTWVVADESTYVAHVLGFRLHI